MILVEAYRLMFQAVRTGKIEKIIECAYKVLEHPVIMTDAGFRKLTEVYPARLTGDPRWDCYLGRETLTMDNLKAFVGNNYIEALQTPHCVYYNEGDFADSPQLCAPVIFSGKIQGYVTILCPSEDYSEHMVKLIEIAADAVSIYLRNAESHLSGFGSLHLAFVRSLFSSAPINEGEAEAWAKQLHINLRPPYIVMAVSSGRKETNTFHRYISEIVAHSLMPILICETVNFIYILIYGQKEDEYSCSYVTEIAGMVRQLGYYCGISRSFNSLSDLNACKLQAECAFAHGRSKQDKENISYYSDSVLDIIVNSATTALGEENCIHPAIRSLENYDREFQTEYLTTLRTYLRYAGKSGDICDAMHIHRNTLNYRINKIEHLTGIDLGNERTLTLLTIGFMVLGK